jgi:uncharacterized phage-associated protein
MIIHFIMRLLGKDKMSYKATEIAWKLLKEGKIKGIELSNLQLQKLVYICHGYMLGWKNKPLSSEPMEAWEYGPVVDSVYHLFKSNGSKVIPVKEDIATGLDGDEEAEHIINGVLTLYGNKGAIDLVSLTHQPGTPWRETWDKNAKHKYSIPISDDLIKNHFRKLVSSPKDTVGL